LASSDFRVFQHNQAVVDSLDNYIRIAMILGTDSSFKKDVIEKISIYNNLAYEDKTAIKGLEIFPVQTITISN
jgi:hypothetical protein